MDKQELLLGNQHISDEQLLIDIRNSEKELAAYERIESGLRDLATLPENAGKDARLYGFKADAYHARAAGTSALLNSLRLLADARGLDWEEQDENNH